MAFYFVSLMIIFVVSIKLFSDIISKKRYTNKHPNIMLIISLITSLLSSLGLAFLIEYCYSLVFKKWHILVGWTILFFSFWVISALVAIFKIQKDETNLDKNFKNEAIEEIKESQKIQSLLHDISKDQNLPCKISDRPQKNKKN